MPRTKLETSESGSKPSGRQTEVQITCRSLIICQSTRWMLRLQLTLSCNLMLLNNLTTT